MESIRGRETAMMISLFRAKLAARKHREHEFDFIEGIVMQIEHNDTMPESEKFFRKVQASVGKRMADKVAAEHNLIIGGVDGQHVVATFHDYDPALHVAIDAEYPHVMQRDRVLMQSSHVAFEHNGEIFTLEHPVIAIIPESISEP